MWGIALVVAIVLAATFAGSSVFFTRFTVLGLPMSGVDVVGKLGAAAGLWYWTTVAIRFRARRRPFRRDRRICLYCLYDLR